MQKDAALAQASTLLTWAEEWARESIEGGTEVGFLLQRTSALISRCVGSPNLAIEATHASAPPKSKPFETIRPDSESVASMGPNSAEPDVRLGQVPAGRV